MIEESRFLPAARTRCPPSRSTWTRASLRQRAPLPHATASCRRADAVRIEELVNYFRYDYPQPDGRRPVLASRRGRRRARGTPEHRLVRIGLQGRDDRRRRSCRRSNLVFLVDVSGSMSAPNKLPLRASRRCSCWSTSCGASDRVAIVVYAGAAGLVLPSTPGDRQGTTILDAHRRGWRPAARPTAARASSSPTTSRSEQLHQGRHQPRDPRHRRRLQRRRHRARASWCG